MTVHVDFPSPMVEQFVLENSLHYAYVLTTDVLTSLKSINFTALGHIFANFRHKSLSINLCTLHFHKLSRTDDLFLLDILGYYFESLLGLQGLGQALDRHYEWILHKCRLHYELACRFVHHGPNVKIVAFGPQNNVPMIGVFIKLDKSLQGKRYTTERGNLIRLYFQVKKLRFPLIGKFVLQVKIYPVLVFYCYLWDLLIFSLALALCLLGGRANLEYE